MWNSKVRAFFVPFVLAASFFCFPVPCLAENIVDLDDDDDEKSKTSWFELGFYSPLQFCGEKTTVNGMRVSCVYTYNKAVNGLDVGAICQAGEVCGLQFAGFNKTFGDVDGFSMALGNVAWGDINGAQLSIVCNLAGSDSDDPVAAKKGNSAGFQLAWVNSVDTVFSGLQIGMLNVSSVLLKGFQIGLINVARQPEKNYERFQTPEFKENRDRRNCIQLGLVNFNSKGFLPVSLIINF
ncbi:MAG: hypothetical protein PHV59_01450 [Victivallales bacterium]|nr:hypothetical protein [Victivallales bacterium]